MVCKSLHVFPILGRAHQAVYNTEHHGLCRSAVMRLGLNLPDLVFENP